MTAHRAFALLAGLAAGALAYTPAAAQVEEGIVLNILRECARIDDPTARLACYDNNIRAAGGQARASVPGRMDAPRGGGAVASGPAAAVVAGTAGGLGSENLRSSGQPASSEASGGDLAARVARTDTRGPGIYVLTLSDGSQWEFAESVDLSYAVPRNGDSIQIESGAFGSYLMRFNQQAGIRVRRVR